MEWGIISGVMIGSIILFFILILYASIRVASRADKQMREMFRQKKEEENDSESAPLT